MLSMCMASVQDSPESRTLVFLRRTIQIQVFRMVVEFVLVCSHNMHVTPHLIFKSVTEAPVFAQPRPAQSELTRHEHSVGFRCHECLRGTALAEMIYCGADVVLSASQITFLFILLFLKLNLIFSKPWRNLYAYNPEKPQN